MVNIAQRAIKKGRTVLIITESIKIYSQLRQEEDFINIDADNKYSFVQANRLHIAMSQTLKNRSHLVTLFHKMGSDLLVMADEAHVGVMTNLLMELPNCYLIGWTATPAYRWAKHLPKLYNEIVVGPQPNELVNDGWLVPYVHWERKAINEADLQMQGGEFTEASQELAFSSVAVKDLLYEDLAKFNIHQGIIYTASCKACDDLYEDMLANGYDVVRVHSNMKKVDAEWNLSQFIKFGRKFCVSVGVLTKGFDHPPIDTVVLWRATTSLPLYLQMIGRGARLSPDTGKTRNTVIDYGSNKTRFGEWDDTFDWRNMWSKKRDKPGVAPMKECPDCGYLMSSTKPACPNCGHIFEKKQHDIVETQLVQVGGFPKAKLSGRNIYEVSFKDLALYAREKNKKQYANKVAMHLDNHFPGYLESFAAEMGYNRQWLYNRMAEKPYLYFADTVLK